MKQGVGIGPRQCAYLRVVLWTARAQFMAQVFPFVQQLSLGFAHPCVHAAAGDLGGIELIPALGRLSRHAGQVGRNGRDRCALGAKARKLRMRPVPHCQATQDLLRKQGFAPQGNEPLRIKILRMYGPDAHAIPANHVPRSRGQGPGDGIATSRQIPQIYYAMPAQGTELAPDWRALWPIARPDGGENHPP